MNESKEIFESLEKSNDFFTRVYFPEPGKAWCESCGIFQVNYECGCSYDEDDWDE